MVVVGCNVIACWCICSGAHLDLDWLCEERAERPAHVYA